MGALRDDAGYLTKLVRSEEMAYVGGGHAGASRMDGLAGYLAQHPDEAHEIGRIIAGTVANLGRAYPGEVRQELIPNEDWREAGYDDVADMNELLGLERR